MTTGPSSSRAYANRRRIMDIALTELLQDPDASMDRIARAAGVVRRTVYGHFPNREALVTALTDSATADVAAAFDSGTDPELPADLALARATVAVWQVADRYRLLIALARRSVTDEGIRARLEPVRRAAAQLIARGLREGCFHTDLPPLALAHLHEHTLFGITQAVNYGALPAREAGAAAIAAVLATVGVGAERAAELACVVTGAGAGG
ncbi:TetR/AcrR family transcriptional regulator [Streptomyces sp. NPDC048644]|uniref:TetR/AcrR family transcriptional regulator n=1 Tax=Streptomyces sp. NPDC048644 TaxID=3365582 RepID=UPI003715B021